MQQSIGEMSRKSSGVAPLKLEICEYLNISVCLPTSGFLDNEVSNSIVSVRQHVVPILVSLKASKLSCI